VRIVVDTREQTPLVPWRRARKGDDPALVTSGAYCLPTVRAALKAGDYSVEGLEHVVAVERKSIADLYGTLYGSATNAAGERAPHLDRFRAELESLLGHERRWWLIEGNPSDLDAYMVMNGRRVAPQDAHSLIASIACDYDIPTIWLGPEGPEARARCGQFLGVVLGRIIEQANDEKAAKKVLERGLSLPWVKVVQL
jgi:ERCC4-type nuclease